MWQGINLSFFFHRSLCWALCISQIQCTGLPSIYPFKPQYPHTNSSDWSSYISFKNSWENLVYDQSILPLVINLVILITFTLDDLLMLLGENWCWSLLGPKGRSTALNVDWHLHHKLFSNIIFFCNILTMACSGRLCGQKFIEAMLQYIICMVNYRKTNFPPVIISPKVPP